MGKNISHLAALCGIARIVNNMFKSLTCGIRTIDAVNTTNLIENKNAIIIRPALREIRSFAFFCSINSFILARTALSKNIANVIRARTSFF